MNSTCVLLKAKQQITNKIPTKETNDEKYERKTHETTNQTEENKTKTKTKKHPANFLIFLL